MSGLSDARDDLALLLATLALPPVLDGGDPILVPTYTYVPEAVTPPAVIHQPGEDYVQTDGTTFNPEEYVLSMDVFFLVDLQDNETAATELDALVEGALALIGPSAWWVQSMSQPQPFHTTEWLAHGIRMTLGTYITL